MLSTVAAHSLQSVVVERATATARLPVFSGREILWGNFSCMYFLAVVVVVVGTITVSLTYLTGLLCGQKKERKHAHHPKLFGGRVI